MIKLVPNRQHFISVSSDRSDPRIVIPPAEECVRSFYTDGPYQVEYAHPGWLRTYHKILVFTL